MWHLFEMCYSLWSHTTVGIEELGTPKGCAQDAGIMALIDPS
jgi:hypothetical protein